MTISQTETFLDLAQRAVAGGLKYAREENIRLVVVVLDAAGHEVALARMDGAYVLSIPLAIAKANTALDYRAPTDELAARVKPENKIAVAQVAPRIVFLGGGVPILSDGKAVGAIGVSGGNEQQDTAGANRALAAITEN